jgi:hypothetical protein
MTVTSPGPRTPGSAADSVRWQTTRAGGLGSPLRIGHATLAKATWTIVPMCRDGQGVCSPQIVRKMSADCRYLSCRFNACQQLFPQVTDLFPQVGAICSRLLQVVGLLGLVQPSHLGGEVRVVREAGVVGDQPGGDLPGLDDDVLVLEHVQQPEAGAPPGL